MLVQLLKVWIFLNKPSTSCQTCEQKIMLIIWQFFIEYRPWGTSKTCGPQAVHTARRKRILTTDKRKTIKLNEIKIPDLYYHLLNPTSFLTIYYTHTHTHTLYIYLKKNKPLFWNIFVKVSGVLSLSYLLHLFVCFKE